VPGRIVDLSPKTARQIGITRRKGVAPVVVAPIVVPQPDGGIKLGEAARERLREQQRLRQMVASTVRPNPSRAQY
ncbi:MAG: hypothetical protein JO042_15425, partial [Sinobacteraceae bacterium]|nr:hypothetical protein [Nevskiaceae bacterium]